MSRATQRIKVSELRERAEGWTSSTVYAEELLALVELAEAALLVHDRCVTVCDDELCRALAKFHFEEVA